MNTNIEYYTCKNYQPWLKEKEKLDMKQTGKIIHLPQTSPTENTRNKTLNKERNKNSQWTLEKNEATITKTQSKNWKKINNKNQL